MGLLKPSPRPQCPPTLDSKNRARHNFWELAGTPGFLELEALPCTPSWRWAPTIKYPRENLWSISWSFPELAKYPQDFPGIPNSPRLFKPRSVKSYFPVLCSNLMNHSLCSLPWRTFWSPVYFPPPPQPTQPASGKNPSVYLSKLGCKYLVTLLRHKLRWTYLLEEKLPREDRSTARASLLSPLQEIAREQSEPNLSRYSGWRASRNLNKSAPKIMLLFPPNYYWLIKWTSAYSRSLLLLLFSALLFFWIRYT